MEHIPHGKRVEAILTSARDLFAQHGYENTGVAEIARKAGVASGTVIYHFKCKENLLFILARQILYTLYKKTRESVRNADNPTAAVEAYVLAFSEYVQQEFTDFRLLLMADPFRVLNTELEAYVDLTIYHSWLVHLLAEVLQRGVDEGAMNTPDPMLSARVIFSMLRSAGRERVLSEGQGQDLYPEVMAFVRARLS